MLWDCFAAERPSRPRHFHRHTSLIRVNPEKRPAAGETPSRRSCGRRGRVPLRSRAREAAVNGAIRCRHKSVVELHDATCVSKRAFIDSVRGQYVWRTVNGTLAVVVPLLVSIVFVCVSSSVFFHGTDSLAVLVGGGFSVGAIVFGGLGLYCLRNWIAGRVDRVEVNTDGILYRQRLRRGVTSVHSTGNSLTTGSC